jgi:hypothetical protein
MNPCRKFFCNSQTNDAGANNRNVERIHHEIIKSKVCLWRFADRVDIEADFKTLPVIEDVSAIKY